ncbi:hypothetical protein LEP1GSC026_3811 [Leptospira interrogans str. 2002000623]|uniref:Uncharacterized protein n=2 Tax=Leptospira interrogans TaxID=173 RepID=A0A829D093_LEPIR|nr:hypothetical protein LEP1GSC027_0791 [Leptospira interrogans str. 2002000624]EKQ48218.1 hypothetical protein LEP1GSC026_3811 [Leptospira interrogans str. 2002000623]EMY02580.1 hypothetical protein LEP1GSC029_4833 [Leptospira interrogans str. 2002000626]
MKKGMIDCQRNRVIASVVVSVISGLWIVTPVVSDKLKQTASITLDKMAPLLGLKTVG